jgi:hypothetical protein
VKKVRRSLDLLLSECQSFGVNGTEIISDWRFEISDGGEGSREYAEFSTFSHPIGYQPRPIEGVIANTPALICFSD